MSDLRAHIKIEFDFMGKEERTEFDINYFADDDGQDQRIKDYFKTCYDKGMDRYRILCAKDK